MLCDHNVVIISNGGIRASIAPLSGANCISLRNEKYGAAILREPENEKELDSSPLYGMPMLFPQNRIPRGKFEFEGREYTFPINEKKTGSHIHGELYKMPFVPQHISKNKASFIYRATEESPYLFFPHAFMIFTEYKIENGIFYHTVRIRNESESNMPLFFGLHTTFNTLFTERSRVGDIRVYADIREEYERDMENTLLPNGNKPPFDEISLSLSEGRFDPSLKNISRHYRGGAKMCLTDVKRGLRAVYENGESYKFCLVYGDARGGYISLEPLGCLAGCPSSPFSREESGFDFLRSGEERIYRSKIYIEEL